MSLFGKKRLSLPEWTTTAYDHVKLMLEIHMGFLAHFDYFDIEMYSVHKHKDEEEERLLFIRTSVLIGNQRWDTQNRVAGRLVLFKTVEAWRARHAEFTFKITGPVYPSNAYPFLGTTFHYETGVPVAKVLCDSELNYKIGSHLGDRKIIPLLLPAEL